jgi:hypothetical protein
MDVIALMVGLAIAAGLVAFVSRPLRQARRDDIAESRLDTLTARYESLLTQLRELDFDHVTGKVIDADHAPLRARLVAEAAEALRQIDAIAPAPTLSESVSDESIEAAIAARRKRAPASAEALDADLEAAIAARRKQRACPHCGKPAQPGDAFCSRCGAAIGAQVAR